MLAVRFLAMIPACLEVGASVVADSPLGRDLLSGRFSEENALPSWTCLSGAWNYEWFRVTATP